MDSAALQEIVASNTSARGVSTLCRPEFWENALKLLVGASRVLVVTGFYIKARGACETDGPPGAVVLGRALARVGKQVVLLTDRRNHKYLKACSRSVGGPVVACLEKSEKIPMNAELLVFLERPGQAADGRYYDMKGTDIGDVVAPLDQLAVRALEHGVPVLAVGDGGNEAGMGLFRECLAPLMPQYARSLSQVSSSVCLPVDVSNWGGYALAACLSRFYGRWVGLDESEETIMLKALLEEGAVDGVSGKSEMSVDGVPVRELEEIALRIKKWYRAVGASRSLEV